MSYDSAYGRGSGRWREEAAKCQRGENFPLPLLMHTHEGARDAFQEQGDNVDSNGHTPEIAASFKISTLESFINLDTQAHTHTRANVSSLSPSGGLLNPYCLFSQTSPLISPRDRSRHTGLATRRETQRGGGRTHRRQSLQLTNTVWVKVFYLGESMERKKSPRREVVGWCSNRWSPNGDEQSR